MILPAAILTEVRSRSNYQVRLRTAGSHSAAASRMMPARQSGLALRMISIGEPDASSTLVIMNRPSRDTAY